MLTVIEVPIEELIPYVNNARTHSDEQVAQIAASIKEFGWTNPILVDGDKGIIAGHGRLAAARKLKMNQVPAIQLDGLSETQKKALILADNKLALNSGWDYDLLKIELDQLSEIGFDLEVVGFDANELSTIMFGEELEEKTPEEFNGNTENKWQLLIEYESENDLANAYDKFMEQGIKCKIIQ
jgi:ParB-like chromosome segregation protein Spo0J